MIKIGKEGIEVSHNRYLSDSSTGFVFLLNLALLIYFKIIDTTFLTGINENIISIDFAIVLLLFLLATSLGMILSFLSWIILEWIYINLIERIWYGSSFILSFLQFKSKYEELVSDKKISYDKWHSSVVCYEEELLQSKVDISVFLIQRGLRIFLRNLSFLLFINSLIFFFTRDICNGFLFLLVFSLIFLCSGAIGFYSNLGLYFKYDIYIKTGTKKDTKTASNEENPNSSTK